MAQSEEGTDRPGWHPSGGGADGFCGQWVVEKQEELAVIPERGGQEGPIGLSRPQDPGSRLQAIAGWCNWPFGENGESQRFSTPKMSTET